MRCAVRTSVVIVWSLALVSVPQRAVRAATDADLASQRAAAIRELGIVHATTLAAGQTDWNIVPVEHLTVETVVGLRFIEGGARTTLSQISLFPNLKVLDLRQDRPSDGELRSNIATEALGRARSGRARSYGLVVTAPGSPPRVENLEVDADGSDRHGISESCTLQANSESGNWAIGTCRRRWPR